MNGSLGQTQLQVQLQAMVLEQPQQQVRLQPHTLASQLPANAKSKQVKQLNPAYFVIFDGFFTQLLSLWPTFSFSFQCLALVLLNWSSA